MMTAAKKPAKETVAKKTEPPVKNVTIPDGVQVDQVEDRYICTTREGVTFQVGAIGDIKTVVDAITPS